MLLLSGDAIVNESMLTGESVPVSKIPVKDEDIARWWDMKEIKGQLAKSFIYAGTQVVRVRGALVVDGTPGRPALGLVVRTGEPQYSRANCFYTHDVHRVQYHKRGLGTVHALP